MEWLHYHLKPLYPDTGDHYFQSLNSDSSGQYFQESYHDLSQEQGIVERLTTGVEALSPSLAVPGGMLVLGLALATYYFNYVWYPTPVVTAKFGKILSDSMEDEDPLLTSHHQKTISKVSVPI